jgi:hypothetical protein
VVHFFTACHRQLNHNHHTITPTTAKKKTATTTVTPTTSTTVSSSFCFPFFFCLFFVLVAYFDHLNDCNDSHNNGYDYHESSSSSSSTGSRRNTSRAAGTFFLLYLYLLRATTKGGAKIGRRGRGSRCRCVSSPRYVFFILFYTMLMFFYSISTYYMLRCYVDVRWSRIGKRRQGCLIYFVLYYINIFKQLTLLTGPTMPEMTTTGPNDVSGIVGLCECFYIYIFLFLITN